MQYEIGDVEELLSRENFGNFAHGCNNRGGFGSGIAGIVAKLHPKCKEFYQNELKNIVNQQLKPEWGFDAVLGFNLTYKSPKGKIINMITQNGYGRDGKKYVRYDAVMSCFSFIVQEYRLGKLRGPLRFPLVGAGLGGGNWTVISALIDEAFENLNVDYKCIVREQDVKNFNLEKYV